MDELRYVIGGTAGDGTPVYYGTTYLGTEPDLSDVLKFDDFNTATQYMCEHVLNWGPFDVSNVAVSTLLRPEEPEIDGQYVITTKTLSDTVLYYGDDSDSTTLGSGAVKFFDYLADAIGRTEAGVTWSNPSMVTGETEIIKVVVSTVPLSIAELKQIEQVKLEKGLKVLADLGINVDALTDYVNRGKV